MDSNLQQTATVTVQRPPNLYTGLTATSALMTEKSRAASMMESVVSINQPEIYCVSSSQASDSTIPDVPFDMPKTYHEVIGSMRTTTDVVAYFSTQGRRHLPRRLPKIRPPAVVRSDPKRDTQEMIKDLRALYPTVCYSIFPRSSEGHSSWDISWFFDEWDFYVHGPAFIYNVIMTMQHQNEEMVYRIANDWSEANKTFYPWLPNQHIGIEQMFAESDRAKYGEEFCRACLQIIRQSYAAASQKFRAEANYFPQLAAQKEDLDVNWKEAQCNQISKSRTISDTILSAQPKNDSSPTNRNIRRLQVPQDSSKGQNDPVHLLKQPHIITNGRGDIPGQVPANLYPHDLYRSNLGMQQTMPLTYQPQLLPPFQYALMPGMTQPPIANVVAVQQQANRPIQVSHPPETGSAEVSTAYSALPRRPNGHYHPMSQRRPDQASSYPSKIAGGKKARFPGYCDDSSRGFSEHSDNAPNKNIDPTSSQRGNYTNMNSYKSKKNRKLSRRDSEASGSLDAAFEYPNEPSAPTAFATQSRFGNKRNEARNSEERTNHPSRETNTPPKFRGYQPRTPEQEYMRVPLEVRKTMIGRHYIGEDVEDLRTLHLRNVKPPITEQDIRDAIGNLCAVEKIRIHRSYSNGTVSFFSAADARKVLAEEFISCGGWRIYTEVPRDYVNTRHEVLDHGQSQTFDEPQNRSQPFTIIDRPRNSYFSYQKTQSPSQGRLQVPASTPSTSQEIPKSQKAKNASKASRTTQVGFTHYSPQDVRSSIPQEKSLYAEPRELHPSPPKNAWKNATSIRQDEVPSNESQDLTNGELAQTPVGIEHAETPRQMNERSQTTEVANVNTQERLYEIDNADHLGHGETTKVDEGNVEASTMEIETVKTPESTLNGCEIPSGKYQYATGTEVPNDDLTEVVKISRPLTEGKVLNASCSLDAHSQEPKPQGKHKNYNDTPVIASSELECREEPLKSNANTSANMDANDEKMKTHDTKVECTKEQIVDDNPSALSKSSPQGKIKPSLPRTSPRQSRSSVSSSSTESGPPTKSSQSAARHMANEILRARSEAETTSPQKDKPAKISKSSPSKTQDAAAKNQNITSHGKGQKTSPDGTGRHSPSVSRELANKVNGSPKELGRWKTEYDQAHRATLKLYNGPQKDSSLRELDSVKTELETLEERYANAHDKYTSGSKSAKKTAKKALATLGQSHNQKIEELIMLHGRISSEADSHAIDSPLKAKATNYPALHQPAAQQVLSLLVTPTQSEAPSVFPWPVFQKRDSVMAPQQTETSLPSIESVLTEDNASNLATSEPGSEIYAIRKTSDADTASPIDLAADSTTSPTVPVTPLPQTSPTDTNQKPAKSPPPKSPSAKQNWKPQVALPFPKSYASVAASGATATAKTPSAMSQTSTSISQPTIELGNTKSPTSKPQKQTGLGEWEAPEGPWGHTGLHSKSNGRADVAK